MEDSKNNEVPFELTYDLAKKEIYALTNRLQETVPPYLLLPIYQDIVHQFELTSQLNIAQIKQQIQREGSQEQKENE